MLDTPAASGRVLSFYYFVVLVKSAYPPLSVADIIPRDARYVKALKGLVADMLALFDQGQFLLEAGYILEASVNAGEAHISDLIEPS